MKKPENTRKKKCQREITEQRDPARPKRSWDWDLSNPVADIFAPTVLEQDRDGIVRGVMVSATFIGTNGSTFNGHWEDMDLLSVNKHWGGAFKIWYSVPLAYVYAFRLELVQYLKMYNVDADVNTCEDVLRHKRYILEPEWFRAAGIPLVRLVQKPGEYVVTFPKGYHFGFNLGLNFSEAVNVGTPEIWIDWGKFATHCTCENRKHGGFRTSMVPFVAKYQPDQLKDWLIGKGALFPPPKKDEDGHDVFDASQGAWPQVPPPPTFEDLVDMKVDPPKEVRALLKKQDPHKTRRKALKKRRREEERKAKKLKEVAPDEEDVIASEVDFHYSLFQSDEEVWENMKKRKAELEEIESVRRGPEVVQIE